MILTKFVRATAVGLMLLSGPVPVVAQPPNQDGFVPVDQLQGQEEMPAAPLVAAAYAVAWTAILLYLFSIWRRLGAVEREIGEVTKRVQSADRP